MTIAREMISADTMKQMAVHPAWADGREGYVWCRLDAYLGGEHHLRAELTWDDDSEFEDNETGEVRWYFDPLLSLETNVKVGDELHTKNVVEISLTREDTFALAAGDPMNLWNIYKTFIQNLFVQDRR